MILSTSKLSKKHELCLMGRHESASVRADSWKHRVSWEKKMKIWIKSFLLISLLADTLAAQKTALVKKEDKPATEVESVKPENGKYIFIEAYGLYGLIPFSGAWASDPTINGNAIGQPAAGTAVTYVAGESQKGFGGGANVGYALVSGLTGVIGFQMSGHSASQRETRADRGGTFDVTRTTKTSFMTTTFNVGLRPEKRWNSFGFFGGGGLLVQMPMTVTIDEQTPGETVTGARTSRVTTDKYNLSLGAYGEAGVKYHLGPVALGLGIRVNIISMSDNGNTITQVDTNIGSAATTTSTTVKDSFSSAQRAAEQAKNSGNSRYDLTSPTTVLISNWQITLGATYIINL